jgi:hypothetical protein
MIRKEDGIPGPYEPGQENVFKRDWIHRNTESGKGRYFCIETEETVGGFPDVLAVFSSGNTSFLQLCAFFEFKVSDASGMVRFRRSQLAFMKRNSDLAISTVAWVVPLGFAVQLTSAEVVKQRSCNINLVKLYRERYGATL